MSNFVPEGWSAYDLGDLADRIEGGGTPPRTEANYWNGNIPWASVKDLRGIELNTTEEFISKAGLENSSSKLIPSNTMIIASRMAVGKAVFFNRDVAINQDLKAFYPKDNLDWRYLLHWYLSRNEQIAHLATGSTVKGIRLDDLKLLPINLPPLPEQQKIATILSSVDDVIEKTRAQIDKLKDLKTGMMQELLTKGIGHTEFKDSPVGRIPASWSVKQISDVCSEIVDCVNKTAQVVDYVTPYRMIRTTNVRDGRIIMEGMRYVTEDTFNAWSRRLLLQTGDLIFTREAPVGECGLLQESTGLFLGQRTMVYRADTKKVDNIFLLATMQSEYFQAQIEDLSGGSTTPHLRVPDCSKILLKIPSLQEQNKISSSIASVDNAVEKNRNKLEQLSSFKNALMQDLLTGKVRVKLTDKESAAR